MNQLKEEFDEYLKEKEEVREIIGKIGGTGNSQYKLVSTLFLAIIVVILVAGIILKRISPMTTLLVAILVGVFKIIWMIQQANKSMHFQFWILNSLEIRMNELDKRQRKVLKLLEKVENEKNEIENKN